MAWFILARVLFVGTVAYSAALLRPVHPAWLPNVVFGLAIAGLFVVFEVRLRHTPVTHMLGAMIGGALGLAVAKTIGAALFWANTDNSRVAFLHSFVLLALPYLGLVHRRPQGRVARAGADRRAVPRRRPVSAATASSTPASSSTAASPTSARPGSSTARW